MAEIELRMGLFTQVDDDDYEWLSYYTWGASARYAITSLKLPNGKRKPTSMHRMILSPKPGQIVHHLDGDTFNNRRSNLRIGSHVPPHRPFGLLWATGDLG